MFSPRNRAPATGSTCGVAVLFLSLLVLLPGQAVAQDEISYSIEKVFYGFGWRIDPGEGPQRRLAFLNLTEGFEETYPSGGLFSAFTQFFPEFSLSANASGPRNGTGLLIHLSYHVSALCFELNETVCPLGMKETAISQDTFDLEFRRILEYRDANGNGTYDLGEPVAQEVRLSQPASPFTEISASRRDGSNVALPFNWNLSWESGNITQGALFAGDALLDDLLSYLIIVGTSAPMNFTVGASLFLQPNTHKGIPLTPSQLKLDLHLAPLSYVEADTALALEVALRSAQYRFQANVTGTTESIFTSSEAAEAFFMWSENVTVDGQTRRVGSTRLQPDNSTVLLFLSYPRGDVIVHDPVLGVSLAQGGSSAPPTPPEVPQPIPFTTVLTASFAVVAAVALYAVIRWRRGSREGE